MRWRSLRRIALHCDRCRTGEIGANVLRRVSREETSEILSTVAQIAIPLHQPLDRIRDFRGEASIADWLSNRLQLPNRTSYTEVIGILKSPIDLDFLAFSG